MVVEHTTGGHAQFERRARGALGRARELRCGLRQVLLPPRRRRREAASTSTMPRRTRTRRSWPADVTIAPTTAPSSTMSFCAVAAKRTSPPACVSVCHRFATSAVPIARRVPREYFVMSKNHHRPA